MIVTPTFDPTFNPDASTADLVFDALANPELSLLAIAQRFKISLVALTSWVASPETTQRVAALHDAIVARARLIAANQLAPAVRAISRLVEAADAEPDLLKLTDPAEMKAEMAAAQGRRRLRDSAARAVNLLLRLAAVPASFSRRTKAHGGSHERKLVVDTTDVTASVDPSSCLSGSSLPPPLVPPLVAAAQRPVPVPHPPLRIERSTHRRSAAAVLAGAGVATGSSHRPVFP